MKLEMIVSQKRQRARPVIQESLFRIMNVLEELRLYFLKGHVLYANNLMTGFYEPEYPLQLSSYRNAFTQRTDINVDSMGILRLDKESGEPFWKKYEYYEQYRDAFICLTAFFHGIDNIKRASRA